MISAKESLDWGLGLFAPSVSQLTNQETVELLSRYSYRWIEWRVQTREDIENNPWGRANNTLALNELAVEVANLVPVLQDAGIAVSGLQVDILEDYPDAQQIVIEESQKLGCREILLTGLNYDPSQPYRTQQENFRKVFLSWLDQARGTDLKICLENHMWTIIPSASLIVDLLTGFDKAQIGVMWDPANSCWEGFETYPMALDLIGELLVEVHFKNGAWLRQKDGTWKFTWCDITEGMVNWPQVLKLLDQQDYRGPLMVEDYRPIDPSEKLRRGRTGLEEAITKISI